MMLPKSALTVLALATGCNVFDPSLYMTDGAVDGASRDAAMPLCGRASPPTLCPGPYLFCDGFESENGMSFPLWSGAPVDNYNGNPANAGTVLDIARVPVCLGQHSLHSHAVGGQQQAFVFRTLANPPNPMYVRFFFYLAQSSMPFELLGFHAGSGQFSTVFVDPVAATFTYSTNFSNAMAVYNAPVFTNRWVCLELAQRFDQASGEVELELDGRPLRDVTGLANQPAGATLDTVNVGVISTNSGDNGVNEVYIDEVAISSTPIGCEPM
jgi:hypothetical protein